MARWKTALWAAFALPFVLAIPLQLTAQEAPSITQLEWRNVGLQEQAAAFDSALSLKKYRIAASQAQKLIDDDLEPTPPLGDTPFEWPIWNLIPDENVDGLYHSPSYHFARRLVGGVPEALVSYRTIFGQRAQQALDRANQFGSTIDLAYLSRRFAATRAGHLAKETAGFHALECGDGLLAVKIFTDLLDLDWEANAGAISRRTAALALAHMLVGNRPGLARLTQTSGQNVATQIAGREQSLHAFCRRLGNLKTSLANGPSVLAQRLGHEPATGLQGRLSLDWSHPLPPNPEAEQSTLVAPIRVHEQVLNDRLIFHDRSHVTAIATETGKEIWRQPLKNADPEGEPISADEFFDDLRGAAGEGVYIIVRGTKDIETDRVQRQLVALNGENGKILWQQQGNGLGAQFPNLLFDAAPLISQGTLYLTATVGLEDVTSFVLALDLKTGRIKWATKIGTGVALTYRGQTGEVAEDQRWLGSLPLAMVEGFLLCCDNLGHIAALEPELGRPRFLLTYKRRRITSTGLQGRPVLVRGWDQNPILGHGDRFLVAADDSDSLQAFFVRPPEDRDRRRSNLNFIAATTLPRQKFTQLLGFDGQNAVLAGREPLADMSIVRCTPVFISQEPKDGWTFPTATNLLGRGYFGQKKVYFSTHKYVYGIDLGSGSDSEPMIFRESNGRNILGHVTMVPGGMIVASKAAVQRYGKSQ